MNSAGSKVVFNTTSEKTVTVAPGGKGCQSGRAFFTAVDKYCEDKEAKLVLMPQML